jgi:hypothetical protein
MVRGLFILIASLPLLLPQSICFCHWFKSGDVHSSAPEHDDDAGDHDHLPGCPATRPLFVPLTASTAASLIAIESPAEVATLAASSRPAVTDFPSPECLDFGLPDTPRSRSLSNLRI